MSNPPLISSQRYLSPEVIARKAAKFKVFVVRTVDLEMRGRLIVQPKDGPVKIADWRAGQNVAGVQVPGVPSTDKANAR